MASGGSVTPSLPCRHTSDGCVYPPPVFSYSPLTLLANDMELRYMHVVQLAPKDVTPFISFRTAGVV